MNIKQAVTFSQIQQCVGVGLLFGGALFYFVSLLMVIYRAAQGMSNSVLFWRFGSKIQNFIAAIYELTAPYIGFVWRNVPTISQADPFTYGNLVFLGLIGVMIVGKQMLLAGRRLRARTQRQIDQGRHGQHDEIHLLQTDKNAAFGLFPARGHQCRR